eukprot:3481288-Pyramimonas_sp.AAC.1
MLLADVLGRRPVAATALMKADASAKKYQVHCSGVALPRARPCDRPAAPLLERGRGQRAHREQGEGTRKC